MRWFIRLPIKKIPEIVFMKKSTLRLTRGAVSAALYFALSAAVPVITYGPVQFRVAEALTLLPFFMPEAIWGVTLGCLLTNAFSSFGIYDVVFGTLTTLVAALITSKIKNRWLAPLPPVLLNAVVLPTMWHFMGSDEMWIINFLSILASESVILYALGEPLVIALERRLK